MTKILHKPIQDVKLHDHTCLIFSSQIEFFHCVVPFVSEGLKRNERCCIVLDEIKRDEVIKNFKYLFRGVSNPFEEVRDKKRIIIEDFKNVYLEEDIFSLSKAKNSYSTMIQNALKEGYTGLRVFAELSNSVNDLVDSKEFLEWEEFADKLFAENNFLAVCAYNKNYFSEDYISKAQKIHPIEINLIKTRF